MRLVFKPLHKDDVDIRKSGGRAALPNRRLFRRFNEHGPSSGRCARSPAAPCSARCACRACPCVEPVVRVLKRSDPETAAGSSAATRVARVVLPLSEKPTNPTVLGIRALRQPLDLLSEPPLRTQASGPCAADTEGRPCPGRLDGDARVACLTILGNLTA